MGGDEGLQRLQHKQQVFVPFIEKAIKEKHLYHAMLGCMIQARINVHLSKDPDAPLASLVHEMLLPWKEDSLSDCLSKKLYSEQHSNFALFKTLISPDFNPASPLTDSEAKQMSIAFLTLLLDWQDGKDLRRERIPIMQEFGKLVTQYGASPFKDISVAFVGAEELMDLAHLGERSFHNEQPKQSSFLFKHILHFNDATQKLNEINCQAFEKVDRVIDCNVSCSGNWQSHHIPKLCAALAKPDGIVIIDDQRGGWSIPNSAFPVTHKTQIAGKNLDYLSVILLSERAFQNTHSERIVSQNGVTGLPPM